MFGSAVYLPVEFETAHLWYLVQCIPSKPKADGMQVKTFALLTAEIERMVDTFEVCLCVGCAAFVALQYWIGFWYVLKLYFIWITCPCSVLVLQGGRYPATRAQGLDCSGPEVDRSYEGGESSHRGSRGFGTLW